MPYSGNFYAELNRFKAQATTTTLTAGIGANLYCSVFGVPDEFRVERIRIIENGNITTGGADNIDIKILSDPGKYRESEATTVGSGEPYVIIGIDDAISETAPNTFWLYDDVFDPPLAVYDGLNSNCMHFLISSDAALSDNAIFTIYVEGYKLPQVYDTSLHNAHQNGKLQVLRYDSANLLWHKLDTLNLDYNKKAAIDPFVIESDYLYFGMDEVWNGLWFNIRDKNTTVGITQTWEYWNGAGWVALTVRDNCTDDETTSPTVFYNSGVIEWDTPAWKKDTIYNALLAAPEPPYDHEEDIYSSKWDERYWVRCNIDDVTTAPTFYWIREKPQVI